MHPLRLLGRYLTFSYREKAERGTGYVCARLYCTFPPRQQADQLERWGVVAQCPACPETNAPMMHTSCALWPSRIYITVARSSQVAVRSECSDVPGPHRGCAGELFWPIPPL